MSQIQENQDIEMLRCLLEEAGWRSKSHTVDELLKALYDGERICRLDSGSSGEDDLLIGDAHDVDVDVCSHFEIEEIPEGWEIADVTEFLEWNMW
jgi:hypothetical protein